jgi:class 3 adenylate cyclase
MHLNFALDIRYLLPTVGVPTLVIHQRHDHLVPVEMGRYLAEHIPGAKYVELPGMDHLFWFSHAEEAVDAIHDFLLGARAAPVHDRLLATVMFADIVSSTEQAVRLGDERWRDVLESYHSLARRRVSESGGREVKTLGDGFLATFDSPTRAIRCATTIRDASRGLGLEVRSGLHAGECEIIGDDVGGLAVHIGARVSSAAGPGEVLVSSTVHDLVVGSGIDFTDRGTHALKGVPGEWRLYAVS